MGAARKLFDLAFGGSLKKARTFEEDVKAIQSGESSAAIVNLNEGKLSDRYESGTLNDYLTKKGFYVYDDKFGNVIFGKDKQSVEYLKNAKNPYEYGKAYGYSDADIAKFYQTRRRGNEMWQSEFLKDRDSSRGILDYSTRDFDPTYDTTKIGQQAIRNMQVRSNVTGPNSGPEVSLVDFEGHPYVATQSDRLDSGRTITGINNIDFNIPVRLPGGQGYMFENPKVWASDFTPAQQIIDVANYLHRQTGKTPIITPWRMAATGGDHAHATGQTLLAYAQAALGKSEKKKFDRFIKEMRSTEKQGNKLLFPDWPGVDSSEAIKYFNNSSSDARKRMIELIGGAIGTNKPLEGFDVLRAGQARVAVSDPSQLNMPQGGFQNIGFITPNRNLVGNTNNTTYGYGVLGEGIGTLKPNQQRATIWDFMTPSMDILDEQGKKIKGLGKQELIRKENIKSSNKLRPYQMKAYGGIIDDKLLKRLDKKGLLGAGVGADLVTGSDISEAGSDKPFLPTMKEYGLSALRGAVQATLDSMKDGSFVPGFKKVAETAERVKIPDYKAKYATDEQKTLFELLGSLIMPVQ